MIAGFATWSGGLALETKRLRSAWPRRGRGAGTIALLARERTLEALTPLLPSRNFGIFLGDVVS